MNKFKDMKCNTPTCPLPVFATRKDDSSIGYCMAHGMEYAMIMRNKENAWSRKYSFIYRFRNNWNATNVDRYGSYGNSSRMDVVEDEEERL